MAIKNDTPKQLVFTVSIMVAGLFVLFGIILFFFVNSSYRMLALMLATVVAFACIYFILKSMLNKSLYQQLQGMYKLIYDIQDQNESKNQEINLGNDVVEEMRKEVMHWAESKKSEVKDLKESASYRKQYLGNVSHELKTPIFNIQGYVDTLINGAIDDPNVNRRYLIKASKSVDRMIAIIEDLEEISKLESGKLKINYEEFDLIELINEVFDSLEVKAEEKSIRLMFSKEQRNPLKVIADENLVRHVVENLIFNSIRYGNENGCTKIGFFEAGENILVEVQDDGIGVEKQHLPHLFERFYRVDDARAREAGGTGLGLAIVKHILEAHNQTIRVSSTHGKGSIFAFTLRKA